MKNNLETQKICPDGKLDIRYLPNEDLLKDFWITELKKNPILGELDRILESGFITLSDGSRAKCLTASLSLIQAMTLFYIARVTKPNLTVETGFGIGTSAITFIAAQISNRKGLHIAIDPFGLPDNRSDIASSKIIELESGNFQWIKKRSEIALPIMLDEGKLKELSVSYIDGGHLFDNAFIDFFYFDKATKIGGIIIVDDVRAAAPGTLLNYIKANKKNYRVNEKIRNLAILQKIEEDKRPWNHFRPFTVAQWKDWTPKS